MDNQNISNEIIENESQGSQISTVLEDQEPFQSTSQSRQMYKLFKSFELLSKYTLFQNVTSKKLKKFTLNELCSFGKQAIYQSIPDQREFMTFNKQARESLMKAQALILDIIQSQNCPFILELGDSLEFFGSSVDKSRLIYIPIKTNELLMEINNAIIQQFIDDKILERNDLAGAHIELNQQKSRYEQQNMHLTLINTRLVKNERKKRSNQSEQNNKSKQKKFSKKKKGKNFKRPEFEKLSIDATEVIQVPLKLGSFQVNQICLCDKNQIDNRELYSEPIHTLRI
ncbi:UNKNOWN [Stylonychia lemnae]|uniref:Uncharacterized protein n=1 Tax=Stylonychia lemnae TaxID=5949 RepID=A0A078AM41_STYLE|nr:UNKNOWN [Stylonychia lemnae]|eukprot:CDW82946.1 UNKNOWN [Stylonychia lemnae]